jgi:hypothetical protein
MFAANVGFRMLLRLIVTLRKKATAIFEAGSKWVARGTGEGKEKRVDRMEEGGSGPPSGVRRAF